MERYGMGSGGSYLWPLVCSLSCCEEYSVWEKKASRHCSLTHSLTLTHTHKHTQNSSGVPLAFFHATTIIGYNNLISMAHQHCYNPVPIYNNFLTRWEHNDIQKELQKYTTNQCWQKELKITQWLLFLSLRWKTQESKLCTDVFTKECWGAWPWSSSPSKPC